ncbi:GDSL-type esterase/lipase family protein [Parvibaculum sp.]|uniref:GDSL-type esterase/lipase family protein n=1 Tax=Parvibaculum sp. TaxID=2024848 RepID=UPI00391BC537
MKRTFVVLGIAFGVAVAALFAFLIYVPLASGDAKYWEGEIAAFERRDVSNPPPENAVLFVGGRDLRLWPRFAEDMAPVTVIQRGFGGAQISHIDHYRARIVLPYDPRAVVVMAGEADLSDVRGRRPEDLLDDFRTLALSLRAEGEDAPIYFVSLRPAPAREERWYGQQRANALIADYVRSEKEMYFIDVSSAMLDDKGNIRDDLYRWDGLTLNGKGYETIGPIIRQRLIDAGYGALRPSR